MSETPITEHNPQRDPDEWLTGDEPSTGPQESYLHTLAQEAGEPVPSGLSKAEASKEIDRLQHLTGRGESEPQASGQQSS